MKEIEILTEVRSDKETVIKSLSKFVNQGIKKTLDVYFFDPLRDELKPNSDGRLTRSFRIRQKNGKCSVAYKVDHFDNDIWTYSDEYETEIGDFEKAIKIIESLGMKELVRIDNEKHTYVSPDYEIVLEQVNDLGLYMEVEKLTEVSDDKVEVTKEEIRTFLKGLEIELGEEQNAGKPELMLRKRSQDGSNFVPQPLTTKDISES
jgi:adenylate cyclase, class 2